MDIQATACPATSAIGAVAGSGQASGKAAGSGDSNFSAILGGQQTAGAPIVSNAPDDQTASLLGLLQMMQLLMSPQQSQAIMKTADDQQGAQTLPELLVQVLNNPAELSDKLLQDPSLQQWLAQASALIPTLATSNNSLPSVASSMAIPAGTEQTQLSAQETLLQFADLAKKFPDNPIVRHLMNELRNAVEPMIATAAPTGNVELLTQLQPVEPVKVEGTHLAKHAQKATAQSELNGMASILVEVRSDNQVQQTKSKLEVLAARSGGIAAAVQQQLSGQGAEESGSHDASQDTSTSQTPAMPLQDLLKTLQQADTAPKLPQATIQAQTYVRDMSEFMVKNMKLSVSEVFKEARLTLHPENLGQVDVKITLHSNGQLVAQLTADNAAGRQLLESQLPQLRQALQSQGMQVERLEVAQESAASSMFQQSRQQSGGGQPFERNNRERTPELDAVDGELANDLRTLAEHRKEQEGASGSSFDATA